MRRAFTLLEVLIVMAILAILIALLAAAGLAAKRKARGEAARAELRAMETALERYRSRFGAHPPDGAADLASARTEGAKALYEYLARFDAASPLRGAGLPTPYYTPSPDRVDESAGLRRLVDPWGRPWIFVSKGGGLDPKRNPLGLDLVSPGPDGEVSDGYLDNTATNPQDEDNISN